MNAFKTVKYYYVNASGDIVIRRKLVHKNRGLRIAEAIDKKRRYEYAIFKQKQVQERLRRARAERRAARKQKFIEFLEWGFEPLNTAKPWTIPIYNGYEELYQDNTITNEYEIGQEVYEAFMPQQRQQRKRRSELEYYGPYHIPECTYEPPDRLIELMKTIRAKIRWLANLRLPKRDRSDAFFPRMHYDVYRETVMPITAVPEMESADAHGIQDTIDINQASNVVLTQTQDESTVLPIASSIDWGALSSSDVKASYKAVTDRWLELSNFTWKSSQARNSVVYSCYLPIEAVRDPTTQKLDLKNPNKLVFNMHRLWKGDIEIKIHLNSNKFQIGQLQCSWYYEPHNDASYKDQRNNVYTRSQTDHVLISASSSNEATLYIPYKNHLPYLNTRNRLGIANPLVLGHLTIMVLNPLLVAGTTPDSCHGTVFVRFPKSEFTGMLGTDVDNTVIALPEMEFVKLAEQALHTVNTVTNMDAPSDVRQSMNIVPQASHSWSAGTNTPVPLMPLRLDPLGTTSAIQDNQYEMTVSNVCSKFGLFKQIVWTSSAQVGKIITSFPVAPLTDKTEYSKLSSSVANTLDMYLLPPVAVASGMYAYWRGSLEYRFDIVCSQFHTGRLMVAYVPGASSSSNVTLEMAKASPHVVFTLNEIQQFSYVVPYVADKPFWPRRYAGNYERDNVGAPSHLYVFVLNPLVPMESVPDSVYINIYMRGAQDFELAVPVQPSIGLPLNPNVILPTSDFVVMKPGYAPYYYGTYYNFKRSDGKQPLVARYGPTSGHVAYLDIGNYGYKNGTGYYFEIDDVTSAGRILIDGKLQPVRYMVVLPDVDLKSYTLLPINPQTETACINFTLKAAEKFASGITTEKRQALVDYGNFYFTDESNNTYTHDNPLLRPKKAENAIAWPEGERDQVTNQISTGNSLKSTANGYMLYGENFGDFKDLCRRFQLYSSHMITFTKESDLSKCSFILPLVPQGLTLELGTKEHPNQVFNRCRDGVIPIIANCFRYFRGSLRFKIVSPTKNNFALSIQHRPDRRLRSLKPILCNTVDTAEAVFNHGYASYIQLLGINGTVEFEVPFYQNGCYGLLQKPKIDGSDTDYYYSLGEIAVTIHGADSKTSSMPLMVFYSIADDMDFTTFQGFTSMVLLDDIPVNKSIASVPEMGLWGIATEKIDEKADSIATRLSNKGEKMIDNLTNSINNRTDALFKKLEEVITPNETVINARETLRDTSVLRNLLFSIAHCLSARSLTNIVIAIVQFLVDIGILGLNVFTTCSEALTKLFSTMRGSSKQQDEPEASTSGITATMESDFSETQTGKAATGFITLLITGVTSLFNVKKYFKTSDKEKDWGKMLTKDIDSVFKTSNSVFIFLRNLFSVIEDMIEWVMGKINPTYLYAKYVIRDYPQYKEWIEEVCKLLSPSMKSTAMYDIDTQQRIYAAHTIGDTFVRHLDDDKELRKVMQPILNYQQKLSGLVNDLEAAGQHPYVRKMPYSIRITGPPGIGKSHLSHTLCADLLRSINFRTTKNMVFTLNAGTSKYWDQCDGQPVIDIDDLWAIRSGEHLEAQIAALFAIHSPVVLCPPKAELNEKKMRYNPEIFIQKTNDAFYVPPNICKDAVLRRAHVLIKCELTDMFAVVDCPHCTQGQSITQCDPKWLVDYHHLAFYYTLNPLVDSGWSAPCTYSTLITFLKKEFRDNRDREAELFRQRLQDEDQIRAEVPNQEAPLNIQVEYIKQDMERRKTELVTKMFGDADYQPTTADWITKYMSTFLGTTYSSLKDKLLPSQPEMSSSTDPLELRRLKAKQRYVEDDSWMLNPFIVDQETMELTPEYEFYMSMNHDMPVVPEMADTDDDTHSHGYDDHASTEWASVSAFNTWSEFYDMMVNKWREVTKAEIKVSNSPFMIMCRKLYDEGVITDKMVKQAYLMDRDFGWSSDMTSIAEALSAYEVKVGEALGRIPYSSRQWHHVLGFMQKGVRCAKGKTLFCEHAAADVKDVVYLPDSGSLMYRGKLFTDACKRVCLWETEITTHIWYHKWLTCNPSMLRLYNAAKYSMLPSVFSDSDDSPVTDHANLLTRLKEYVKSIWDKFMCGPVLRVWQFIKKCWPIVMAMSVPLIMGSISCKMVEDAEVRTLQRKIDLVNEWTVPESATTYAKKQANVNLNKKIPTMRPESETPQVEHVVARIQKNTFRITAMFDGKIRQCTCIVLEGRKLLILRHYIEEYKTCPPNTRYFGRYDYQPKASNVYGIEFDLMSCETTFYNVMTPKGDYKSHIGILTLPKEFPESKSIVRFIANTKDHEYVNGNCRLVKFGGQVEVGVRVKRQNKFPHTVVSEDTTAIVMDDVYTYQQHGRGMCGTLLVADNLERPVIGVHVGGVDGPIGYGIAEILTSEMFVEALQPPPQAPHVSSVQPDLKDLDFSKIDLETAIFPYGVVADSLGQHQSGETQYIKSALHGMVEPVMTQPNPLKKNDPRLPPGTIPLKAGCEHFGRPPLSFPEKLLDEASCDLEEVILSVCRPPRLSVGVVDEDIAILGCPAMPGYEPLMWSTSEGFPLKSIRHGKRSGKRWLFDLDETPQGYKLNGMHSELRRLLDLETEMRRRGIKPFTVFTDSLKDTCLPISKCCVPGKTRIFSISPVQFTINFKRYFLDFMVAYRNARFNAEHAIGINVDSMEWTELAGRLQQHGGKIIAGDYKNFGPGLMKSAAHKAFNIIISWYQKHGASDEEQRIRRIMALEVVDSPHLATNLIYYTPCGIPSGSPITTELNSLVNSIYIRCVWKLTTNLSFADLANNTTIVTYGDDVLIGITDDICDIFNTETMAAVFQNYNITFTDADKSSNIVLYRDIHTCTFLKRAFKPHPTRIGVWLASIDTVSIGSCLNWISKVGNHVENTLDNCRAALDLAYGHGPDYYNDLRKRIVTAVGNVLGERFIGKLWHERDMEIFQTMPVMPEMEQNHQYEGWTERTQWAEYATWYSAGDVLSVLRTLRNLNFSLQEQRSEGLQLLNGLIPVPVVSPIMRFTHGRYFCEERPGTQELMSSLRLCLSFKEHSNSNTNGRSAYNDSIVSFHKSVTALINGIVNGSMTYTREKFETTYNLIWH